jgi:hypothetical protein
MLYKLVIKLVIISFFKNISLQKQEISFLVMSMDPPWIMSSGNYKVLSERPEIIVIPDTFFQISVQFI